MQWFIVFIIIICAITYASLRIYKTLTSKNSACSGCPLKDACSKNKTNKFIHKNSLNDNVCAKIPLSP